MPNKKTQRFLLPDPFKSAKRKSVVLMVTIAGAIIGAIITCALSLVGSYIMLCYQLKKQRQYELIKKFVDETNFLFTDCERLVSYTRQGIQNLSEGMALQRATESRVFNLRALVFLINDSAYIASENKKIAEDIYSNFATMLNKQGDVTVHMKEVRDLLSKLSY